MIYFTSDLHLGHKTLLKYRPWAGDSIESMDECLIEAWNSVISPRDTIYVLGDFSFHRREKTLEIAKRLKGHKHLLLGNHDGLNKAVYEQIFESVREMRVIKIAEGHRAFLCHYPVYSWPSKHYGVLHLHGHSHGNLVSPYPMKWMDVGVDVHRRPISEHEAIAHLAEVDDTPVDHHG